MNFVKFKKIWYVLSSLIFSFFRLLNFSPLSLTTKLDLVTVNKILVPFLAIRPYKSVNSFDPFAPGLRCGIPHYKPSDTSTKL